MISVSQVSLSFGAFELFSDITFMINPRDRIGLVGRNGAGKSTLLKMIAGVQNHDTGVISVPEGVKIGYLPQQMTFAAPRSVIDEATSAFSEVLNLEKEIEAINIELALRTDYESAEYSKLIHRLSDANEHFQIIGGASIHEGIEKTLSGLGFAQTDFSRKTTEFSGGWRMRIELAKILLLRPDILLLDEPTNHLDIESITWLEEYLKDYAGAVFLISHDRAFLDNVTNRTIEISLGKSYDYRVNYSKYKELRAERREQQMAAYRNQQKMIEDTEDFIDRFRSKATKAVQVQSRIKQLAKVERIEIDPEDTSAINIRFPNPIKSGKLVLEIKDLSKAYPQKVVLDKITLTVEAGQRIALVGKNGEGKSTLSKIIIGELDFTGEMKIGHNVKIGYFAQNQDEIMDENLTVFDTIDRVAVGDIRTKIRDILGAFLFGGEDVDKKVKVLSGGERSRLAIAKLLLEPYNLLVLDEPTNHLDIRSKDILKNALQNYEGTLIIVSHDRDFLNGLVDRVYEFKERKAKEFLGGIYEFLEKKKIASFRELEAKTQVEKLANADKEITESKQTYLDRKEFEKIIRKAQSRVSESEKRIEQLEVEIAKMNVEMANPQFMSLNNGQPKVFEKYNQLKKDFELEMETWAKLSEEYDELKLQKK